MATYKPMKYNSITYKVLYGLCVAKGAPKHRTQIVFNDTIRQGDINLALKRLASKGYAYSVGANRWVPTAEGVAELRSMAKHTTTQNNEGNVKVPR